MVLDNFLHDRKPESSSILFAMADERSNSWPRINSGMPRPVSLTRISTAFLTSRSVTSMLPGLRNDRLTGVQQRL